MESIAFDQYVEFKCIGGDCPYTCCGGGWEIEVDAETDKFYQSCDGEFGEYLNKCIIRENGKAFMAPRPDGRCALLSPDGLCNVQLAYGEEHLCDTCKHYPRISKDRGALHVFYMTPSCPEVARELLERKQPLHVLHKRQNDREANTELDVLRRKAFFTAIRVLQDRDCDIVQRQQLFLLMSKAVQNALDGREPRKAEKVLAAFSVPEEYRKLTAELDVAPDAASKIQTLKLLAPLLMTEGANTPLPRIFRRAVDYLQDPSADLGAFAAYLRQIGEKKQQRQMENLLLGLLPAKYLSNFADGNLYRQAVQIVLQAQLYRVFSAVGFAGGTAEEDKTRGALIVSYISRYFDHARGALMETLDKLLTDSPLAEPGFLCRLIS